MRWLLTIFMLSVVVPATAQNLRGRVINAQNGAAVSRVKVYQGTRFSMTSTNGDFTIGPVFPGDSLRLVAAGYETQTIVVKDPSKLLLAELIPLPIQLEEVLISAPAMGYRDTVSWRKVMERRLAKQALRERQLGVFSTKDFTNPFWSPDRAKSSSASILTLDVGKLVGLLRKKKEVTSVEQSWDDATEVRINQFFNPETVSQLTKLSGDALDEFMMRYYPQPKDLSDVSEYEIIRHIKNSLLDFDPAKR